MRPTVGLLFVLVAVACQPAIAQPRLPLESLVGPPAQLSDLEYRRLRPLYARAMLRGFCFATSTIDDTNALGGFAQWGNVPRTLTSEIDAPRGMTALLARPDERTAFAERYRGMRLYIANTSDTIAAFRASDSRLYVIQEALDEHGDWRFIEYLQSSFCGNSYHTLFLRPGEFWAFDAPRYHGSFRTRLRFRLMTETYPVERSLYSNEFDGSINPEQFTELQGYGRGGIMDPYTSIRPAGLRYGLIDRDGGVLIAPRFEEMYPAGEHFAVKVDGHWGFVDRFGRTLVEPRFDGVGTIDDGLGAVNFGARLDWSGDVGGGLWGLVDLGDSLVVVPAYDHISEFSCGVATVSAGGCSGLIDRSGDAVIPLEYDHVSFAIDPWRDPDAIDAVCPSYVFVRRGTATGIMRIDGSVLLEPIASDVATLDARTIAARIDDVWMLLKEDGRRIPLPGVQRLGTLRQNRIPVRIDGKWGYIDSLGQVVVSRRFSSAEHFVASRARVRIDGADRFIDTAGTLLDADAAPDVSRYEERVASDTEPRTFQRDDRWGLMDSARRVLIEPTWAAPIDVTEDRAIVFDGEHFGVVTITGDEIVAPRYRLIRPYHGGTAIVAVGKEEIEE